MTPPLSSNAGDGSGGGGDSDAFANTAQAPLLGACLAPLLTAMPPPLPNTSSDDDDDDGDGNAGLNGSSSTHDGHGSSSPDTEFKLVTAPTVAASPAAATSEGNDEGNSHTWKAARQVESLPSIAEIFAASSGSPSGSDIEHPRAVRSSGPSSGSASDSDEALGLQGPTHMAPRPPPPPLRLAHPDSPALLRGSDTMEGMRMQMALASPEGQSTAFHTPVVATASTSTSDDVGVGAGAGAGAGVGAGVGAAVEAGDTTIVNDVDALEPYASTPKWRRTAAVHRAKAWTNNPLLTTFSQVRASGVLSCNRHLPASHTTWSNPPVCARRSHHGAAPSSAVHWGRAQLTASKTVRMGEAATVWLAPDLCALLLGCVTTQILQLHSPRRACSGGAAEASALHILL